MSDRLILEPSLIWRAAFLVLLVFLVSALDFVPAAEAGESFFGWIYTADIHPPGTFEYEHRSFLQQGQSRGRYSYLRNSEELEMGVTPNFQIAGYINWSYRDAARNGIDGATGGPGVGSEMPLGFNSSRSVTGARFDSASVEMIYQILNPYTDPFGLAVYIEPEFGPRVTELEWRIILQKNFLDDRLILAANITGQHEREKSLDLTTERASPIDLAVGASYRVADNWFVGLEGRMHNEFTGLLYKSPDHSAFFLGPNVHYATQNYWITAAWRHQLPLTVTYNQDQASVLWHGRIYGDEHARDEIIVKVGIPF